MLIAKVHDAFAASGDPVDPEAEIALGIMLDDLAWWSKALEGARAAGELAPASARRRQALAALAKAM